MATGKELVRMMTCSLWDEHIKTRKDFVNAEILDNTGKKVSLAKAKKLGFCCAKILFKGCCDDSLNLMAILLRNIASTNSESMGKQINKYYHFQEIIIS